MNAPVRNLHDTRSLISGNEIVLYGVVDPAGFEGIRAIDVVDSLASLSSPVVHVRINSPGGSVTEGIAIYNALKNDRRRVVVQVDAMAGSIASVIALAGDEVVMAENASFFIHDPFGGIVGGSRDMRKMADEIDRLREMILNIYAERTGQPRETLSAMMAAETFMGADEAVRLGFATRSAPAMKIAAAVLLDKLSLARLLGAPAFDTAPAPGRPTNAATAASIKDSPMSADAAASAASTLAERARITEINNLVTKLRVDPAIADRLIESGSTIEAARAEVLNALAEASGPETIPSVRVIGDGGVRATTGVERALNARLGLPGGERNEFTGMSIAMMAREHALATGRGGMFGIGPRSNAAIIDSIFATPYSNISAMHSRSDFPQLLLNGLNKTLDRAFELNTSPVLDKVFRASDTADFRTNHYLKFGEMGRPQRVAEGGEIISVSVPDAERETVDVYTFAARIDISRELIVNDDLGGLSTMFQNAGASASQKRNDEAMAIINANTGAGSALRDTHPIFYTSRGNIAGSGGAIDTTTLSTAMAAIRNQKGIDGSSYLNLTPRYLVCGSAYETPALQAVSLVNAAATDDVNPFAGKFEVLVDPRITGNHWYLFCTPEMSPCLQVTYLQGMRTPTVESQEAWDQLGMSIRVYFDFGVGGVGWRGAWFNVGA